MHTPKYIDEGLKDFWKSREKRFNALIKQFRTSSGHETYMLFYLRQAAAGYVDISGKQKEIESNIQQIKKELASHRQTKSAGPENQGYNGSEQATKDNKWYKKRIRDLDRQLSRLKSEYDDWSSTGGRGKNAKVIKNIKALEKLKMVKIKTNKTNNPLDADAVSSAFASFDGYSITKKGKQFLEYLQGGRVSITDPIQHGALSITNSGGLSLTEFQLNQIIKEEIIKYLL